MLKIISDPSSLDSLRCKLFPKMKSEHPLNTDYSPKVSFLQKTLNLCVYPCGNLQNQWKRYKKRYSIRSMFSLIDRSLSQSHSSELGACLISASPEFNDFLSWIKFIHFNLWGGKKRHLHTGFDVKTSWSGSGNTQSVVNTPQASISCVSASSNIQTVCA